MAWIKSNLALFVMILSVVLIALIPLFGILIPPLADLPQQILVSKLLWEKLAGVSHLDIEVSWFLGYRLPSLLITIAITACKLFGIPLTDLPKIVVVVFISVHAIVVTAILYFQINVRSWKKCILAFCFAIPAATGIYVASWFIGFIGFTLGITILIPAIFFTERFLDLGKRIDAVVLFLALALVYFSHPFALVFWGLWYFSRWLAAIAMRSVSVECKKLLLVGGLFLPIFLYHFLAPTMLQLAPSNQSVERQSPFVSPSDWYKERLGAILDGSLIKADETSDSVFFGYAVIALILFSIILAFRSRQNHDLKKLVLASFFLIFIPVPSGHWLAYDFRFIHVGFNTPTACCGFIHVGFNTPTACCGFIVDE